MGSEPESPSMVMLILNAATLLLLLAAGLIGGTFVCVWLWRHV